MERPWFGYRRLHVMLRRKGGPSTRSWCCDSCARMGRKLRKKLAALPRVAAAQPTGPNEAWAMDFVFEGTAGGRTFRTLNVIARA